MTEKTINHNSTTMMDIFKLATQRANKELGGQLTIPEELQMTEEDQPSNNQTNQTK